MPADSSNAEAWPLAGLRIVDLTTQIAGPYATKLFVDGGAEVVKVEPPGGDPLRGWTASGASLAPGQDGALFQFLNASKQSIAADPSQERELILDLAANADLLFHDLRNAEAEALGLGMSVFEAACPKLSVVSITPWGGTGPWAERPCTEFTLQASTGSVGYRGLRDRKPVAAGGRFGEWLTGVYAAVGGISSWVSARPVAHAGLRFR